MNRDYQRISEALQYIEDHSFSQPELDDVAGHVNLSPHHFHRMFVRFCGVTPKQFLKVLTVNNAKLLLEEQRSTNDVALDVGLSGTSRLYDHFVSIESVTPGEFKSAGDNLIFFWGTSPTPFGDAYIAWTEKGIHTLEFFDNEHVRPHERQTEIWHNALFKHSPNKAKKTIDSIFDQHKAKTGSPIRLWLHGTDFQIQVWKALLNLKPGELTNYQELAKQINKPKASRAVGSAIGKNPVAYLIPCHRVIQSTGAMGGYRWDPLRKKVMLGKELAINLSNQIKDNI